MTTTTAIESTRASVRKMRARELGAAAACLSILAACATPGTPQPAPTPSPRPTKAVELVSVDPRAVVVFDGGTGQRMTWAELLRKAGASEVILVGENHGHPLGLACAAALFEDLVATHGCAALSLEFFERDEQSRLDDWLAGLSDEKAFMARTQRSKGNYPDGHRAMLYTAKDAQRPVIAANAPRAYVRVARERGYAALQQLTAEQRRLFHLPYWLFDGRYRAEFNHFMSGGWGPYEAKEEDRLATVFRSQSLWDWTMADSICEAVASGNKPLVHVVGRFHVDHQGGTVQAVRILRPGTNLFVLSFVAESATELQDEDRQRGDAVIYVGPN